MYFMPRLALLGLVCLLLIPVASQAQESGYTPVFEESECWFEVSPGQTITCGYVVVPESRNNLANSRELRLAVAWIKADDPQNDPLFMLSGGPGEKFVQNAPPLQQVIASCSQDVILLSSTSAG